jgi:hypothetical protein
MGREVEVDCGILDLTECPGSEVPDERSRQWSVRPTREGAILDGGDERFAQFQPSAVVCGRTRWMQREAEAVL